MTIRELKNYIDGLLTAQFVTEDSEILCETSDENGYGVDTHEITGVTIWRSGNIELKLAVFNPSEHEE
jgi:hypothetical protein